MFGCTGSMKVLCVSLHVSHGYVGNRACTFPLQYQGWDVDAVNTTNFSNHPGYGKIGGRVVDPDEVQQVIEGLGGIVDVSLEYDMVISGYCPRPETVVVVRKFCANLKPLVALVVDPVLGDNGKLYVQETIVPEYGKLMAECPVSLTTPNLFEFELLSGYKVNSWSDLRTAINAFYEKYHIPNVVILSINIEGQLYAVGALRESRIVKEKMTSDSSNLQEVEEQDGLAIFYFPIEKLDCNFNGSGDVLTAIVSHCFYKNGCKLTPETLSEALTKLEHILKKSMQIEAQKTGEHVSHVKDIQIVALRAVLDMNPTMRPVFWIQ